jgi:biotin operon repressor
MTLTRFDWERAIRQLPIRPPMLNCVALMLATYADRDGKNAHPSEARLASDIGISTRAVRGHLATLRDLGLIERVFTGSAAGRRKLADTYELAQPPDVLARVEHRNESSCGKPEHRNEASGDSGGNTGTSVHEHRNLSAEHRNLASKNTGSQVPPTVTGTKDADHSSPQPGHLSEVSTASAREVPKPPWQHQVDPQLDRAYEQLVVGE